MANGKQKSVHTVMAAFIYNFTKFVVWPDTVFETDSFKIGIIGIAELYEEVTKTVEGKSINNKQIVIEKLDEKDDLSDFSILFISDSDEERMKELLHSVKDMPVLTISDLKGFTKEGGIIEFFIEGRKIRFDINNEAAVKSGLKISSKLLRLAKDNKE